jgi:AMMECR1 domain-containing protein
MFTAEPVDGVRVTPVMVAVKAWTESCEVGAGGVAVNTKETAALLAPQLATQPP